jgi:DNA-binding NtrC family response regulator
MPERLLIVEDERTLSESLKRVFMRDGYEVDTIDNAEAALKFLEGKFYDLIISDIILPGINGIEFLRKCKEQNPDQIVIIMTAYASLETAVEALRAGAYDYVMKPIIHEEIKKIISNALRERSLKNENQLLRKQLEERYDFERIIGRSREITTIIGEVKKVSDTKSNILILGETGTGKELFARAIHYNSSRRDKPFIPINCSAIPDNLLESELFGYTKGAFTGAVNSKRGLFDEGDGGTIFLDEIGELSMQMQSKLLRVIDDKEIRPIGGVQSRKVDMRFIVATNKDLSACIKNSTFREDLYYRINVITIKLPTLRERKEDIIMLASYFLDKYSGELGKHIGTIDNTAQKMLTDYHWPGNVRELQNIIERAVLIAEDNTILPEHISEGLRTSSNPYLSESINKKLSIEDYTKEFIIKYQSIYNEQKLSELLGITRKSLWEKRKKWGIGRT